jgi:Na+/H+-dicarboxylate symporter
MEANRLGGALEHLHPRSLARLADNLQGLTKGKLWLQVLIGMVLGVGLGVALGPSTGWVAPPIASAIGEWIALPGYLFLAVVQMIVVPLMFASVVRGIASNENADQLRKTGLRLVLYLLATTTVAVVIGLSMSLLLKPGAYIDLSSVPGAQVQTPPAAGADEVTLATLPQELISVIPKNPLGSMARSEMLQIVIVAIVFGLALVGLPAQSARPLLELLGSLESVCMAIVRWVMVLAPFAVFGLLAKVTMGTGLDVLLGVGVYTGVTLLGFLVLLVFYMLVVAIGGRRRPSEFLKHIRDAQLMAFSTNSSAATMPLSLKVAEENLKVRPSTARFVIPIGATINMDASALYQGMATVFIAQVYGIDLSLTALLALVVTAVGASIGTPATPGVGIIVLSTVLTSAGVPLEGLTLIIGVDRILELFRASLNVTGDLVACTVMDRIVPDLPSPEEEAEREAEREREREASGRETVLSPA